MTRIATLTLFAALLCFSTTSLAQQVQVKKTGGNYFIYTEYSFTLETDDTQSKFFVSDQKPLPVDPEVAKEERKYTPENWKVVSSDIKELFIVQKIKHGLRCITRLTFTIFETGEVAIKYVSKTDIFDYDQLKKYEDYDKLMGLLTTLHFTGKSGKSLFFGKVYHPKGYQNRWGQNEEEYNLETSKRKFNSAFKDIPLEDISAKNFSVECFPVPEGMAKEDEDKIIIMKDAEYVIKGFGVK